MNLPSLDELEGAARLVAPFVPPTPLYRWPLLIDRTGADVWVKHENHTPIGAFKIRGGLVYFHELMAREPHCPGVIAATRGNHGQSVAFVARQHGLRTVIVVPHGNSREKNAAMQALGAELVVQGHDFQAAFEHAQARRRRRAAAPGSLLSSHAGQRRRQLCPRAVPNGAGPRCRLRAYRFGLRHLRRHCGARRFGAGDAHHRRRRRAVPCYALSLAAGRTVTTESSDTIADGMACRVPNEEALDAIRRGARARAHPLRGADRGGDATLFHGDPPSRRGGRRSGSWRRSWPTARE